MKSYTRLAGVRRAVLLCFDSVRVSSLASQSQVLPYRGFDDSRKTHRKAHVASSFASPQFLIPNALFARLVRPDDSFLIRDFSSECFETSLCRHVSRSGNLMIQWTTPMQASGGLLVRSRIANRNKKPLLVELGGVRFTQRQTQLTHTPS